MPLWKKETEANPKPKWLSDDEKSRCYCDDRGWVLVHLDGREEVLVAGSGLDNPADNPAANAAQKAAAELHRTTVSLSDDDSDGVKDYRDPNDTDPNVP